MLWGEKARLVWEARGFGLPVRMRKKLLAGVCRERGIRVLALPNEREVCAVVSWLLGQECCGVLPGKEHLREGLGEEAFQLLERALELGSLPAAAREMGYKVSSATGMVVKAAKRAVELMSK